MKPLRQQLESQDAMTARAARLVAAVKPLPESRLRLRRVRLALDRHQDGRPLLFLRPALVLGVLFGGIATAGATWGVVQLAASDEVPPVALPAGPREATLEASSVSVQRVHSGTQPPVTRSSEVVDAPEPEPEMVDQKPSPEPPTPARKVISRKASQMSDPISGAEVERSGAAAIELSDSVLVHNAVKELRNGGDAREASRLLERYRVQNPDGVLAEEALALSIEAAVAKRDPAAKLLARQYLSKYPNGRFAPAARRASR